MQAIEFFIITLKLYYSTASFLSFQFSKQIFSLIEQFDHVLIFKFSLER